VWKALQDAISDAGFRIEGTQTFDKRHGTFKQFVSRNAVGYDLVLHCRKSDSAHKLAVRSKADLIADATTFVRDRLAANEARYAFHFLHVTRATELDIRRLYAEWLASAVADSLVSLSYEEFREAIGRSPSDVETRSAQLTLALP
jgi:hypothetical protein